MPRVYKRRLDARPYRNYTQGYLDEAVNAVKSKQLSLREASSRYGIHRNTIWRKVHGMSTNNYGGKAVFDQAEETSFVNHIAALSRFGFPISINDLRYIAKQYLDRTERIVSCFKDNLPGRDWATSFMKRYKCSLPTDTLLDYSSATSNEEVVFMFFENLEKEAEGIPASNIWSYDETNLADDLNSKKIISKRGMKYPDHKYNALKACTSVTLLGNAGGYLAPLYVNYQAEKLKPSWTEGGPDGTRYNRTNSGWCDYHTFEDWFLSICLPLLKEQRGTKILIGDIVSSPISLEVLKLCVENDIKLLALPKKSGHLLQPINIAFFYSMKCYWPSILGEWMGNSHYGKKRATLPKDKFPFLLQKMMSEMTDIKENIKAGFHKAGIYPLDRSQVLHRMPSAERRSNSFVRKTLREPFISQLNAWERTIQDSSEEEYDYEDIHKPSTSTRRSCKEENLKGKESLIISKSSTETLRNCDITDENKEDHLNDGDFSGTDESSDFLDNDKEDNSISVSSDLNDGQSDTEPISVYQIQGTYKVENKKYIIVKLVGSCKTQS